MPILVYKNILLQKSSKPFFSSKLCHQWSIGLLVLLTRTFFPTGSGGFKMAGTDIKKCRPNRPRGQFSKKISTTTFYKCGFLTIYRISRWIYKIPGGPNHSNQFFYCVLNSTKTISCRKVLKSFLAWSFYFGLRYERNIQL